MTFQLETLLLLAYLAHGSGDHTLLLGGRTPGVTYSSSLELLMPSMTCNPAMAPMPVGRFGAAAVLLGDKILHCGGYNSKEDPFYHSSCHSYTLGDTGDAWAEDYSMTLPRMYFAMSVVGDRVYASGGMRTKDTFINTLEYYTPESGWAYNSSLTLESFRYWHCSVGVGSELYVIGGSVGMHDTDSNSVMSYDTAKGGGWVDRQPLKKARYIHACQAHSIDSQEGIVVSGGYSGTYLSSVEFYDLSTEEWRDLGKLTTARDFHTMTLLGSQLVIAGGEPDSTAAGSVETWDGTSWVGNTDNLATRRWRHAAVSIPEGMITC